MIGSSAAKDTQGRSRISHEWRCAATVKVKSPWLAQEYDGPCAGAMEFSPAHAWKFYRSAPACAVDARHGPMNLEERKQ